MADVPTGKSILDGTIAQAVGCGIGTLYVLGEASKGHYFAAGYELALGNLISAGCYVLWKVFGPRILNWATSNGKLPEANE